MISSTVRRRVRSWLADRAEKSQMSPRSMSFVTRRHAREASHRPPAVLVASRPVGVEPVPMRARGRVAFSMPVRERRLEGGPPKLSLCAAAAPRPPRLGRTRRDKAPLGERFRNAVVKPAEPDAVQKARRPDAPMSVEELEEAVRSADDKERLTGLLLAPVAAAIGLLVISDLITNDPAAHLKNGRPSTRST